MMRMTPLLMPPLTSTAMDSQERNHREINNLNGILPAKNLRPRRNLSELRYHVIDQGRLVDLLSRRIKT
jgi:hypothetical protein